MSSGEVGWDCKDWWLGLDTSVLLSNRDRGVPVTGLLCAVVVEHKRPGQGTGCTCGAGVAPLSLGEGMTPALALVVRPSQTQKRPSNYLHISQNNLGLTDKPSPVSPLYMMHVVRSQCILELLQKR